jgi:hypothetical protein
VIISAAPGKSDVVVGSQTLSAGGGPITISGGGVVSIAPSGGGVVISNSGEVSTIALPSAPVNHPPVQTLGVVAGQTIAGAVVGSSQLVVGSQTLSVGGPVVTLIGNQVASLGSSGLVIQAPSGVVSTYSIQTSTPALIGVIAGQTVSGVALGSSSALVGSQTFTIGGPIATLPGNQVASLGVNGLVVQAPGGVVTTIPVQLGQSYSQSSPLTIMVGPGTTESRGFELPSPPLTSNEAPRTGTSTTSTSPTTTGLGNIIMQTFQGTGVNLVSLELFGWVPCLVFGIMLVLR